MKKCVGAIEEFEFLPLNSGKHLHLTITVTGWLCSGKYSKYSLFISNYTISTSQFKPTVNSLIKQPDTRVSSLP